MSTIENIKVLVLDVDGVLTDGKIAFCNNSNAEMKFFNVHDGLGISLWQKAGFHTIIISGREATCVDIRADELDIQYVKQNSKNKIADLESFLQKLGCTSQECCFIGDDFGDIAVMNYVGYSIAVQNAVHEVKQVADWITSLSGGTGAVREAIEYIMKSNKSWEDSISSFSQEYAKQ